MSNTQGDVVNVWIEQHKVRVLAQPEQAKRFFRLLENVAELRSAANAVIADCASPEARDRLRAAIRMFE